MTPKQEARLLRARAQTLKALADAAEEADKRVYDVGLGGPRYRHPAYLEADACEAVAAELEAQAERETKEVHLKREPRDGADECHDFSTQGSRTSLCYGDGHYRCKECIHFGARAASCCGKPLGPGETCGDCTNQKEK